MWGKEVQVFRVGFVHGPESGHKEMWEEATSLRMNSTIKNGTRVKHKEQVLNYIRAGYGICRHCFEEKAKIQLQESRREINGEQTSRTWTQGRDKEAWGWVRRDEILCSQKNKNCCGRNPMPATQHKVEELHVPRLSFLSLLPPQVK